MDPDSLMDQSIISLINDGQRHGRMHPRAHKQSLMRRMIDLVPIKCVTEHYVPGTPSWLELDPLESKYALFGTQEGFISILEVDDPLNGTLKTVALCTKACDSCIHRVQWYPGDTGMFSICDNKHVFIADPNTMCVVERHRVPVGTVHWMDWNPLDPSLIAAGCSGSKVRFLDLRSGDFLQEIVARPQRRDSNVHNITRVAWSPMDSECVIAGDSGGYLHVFDIRSPKRAITVTGEEHSTQGQVVSLTWTANKLNLIVGRGGDGKMSMYRCQNSDLRADDLVKFEYYIPIYDRKNRAATTNQTSAFYRHQILVSDSLVFSPISNQPQEIAVHDANTGKCLKRLASKLGAGTLGVKTVNGVSGSATDNLLLLSISTNNVKVWTFEPETDEDQRKAARYHIDRWDDD